MVTIESSHIGFNNPQYDIEGHDSAEAAKMAFDKHCNSLRDTHYQLQIDYENVEALSFNQPNTQLNESVATFLQRILNSSLILGILNVQEISNARRILNELEKMLKRRPKREQNDLIDDTDQLQPIVIDKSNKFYQIIPHVGPAYDDDVRKGSRPPIETIKLCRAKNEVVNRLEIVLNHLNKGIQTEDVNPLDYFYDNLLKTELTRILPSIEYESFISNFNIHSDDVSQLRNVFRVRNHRCNQRFSNDIGNHHYLFHTARMDHLIDILKDGLQVSPEHVVSYNRWLGKGIYFFGNLKAILSYSSRVKRKIVLVCRVALGEIQESKEHFFHHLPDDYIHKLDNGKNSLRVRGQKFQSLFQRDSSRNAYLPSGVDECHHKNPSQHLLHDEYLIQHGNQVQIEYIIELND